MFDSRASDIHPDPATAPAHPYPMELQLDAAVSARAAAVRGLRFDDPSAPSDGRFDTPMFRCLLRAHDLAMLMGHETVDRVHLVFAMIDDAEVLRDMRSSRPNLLAGGVRQACLAEFTRLPHALPDSRPSALPISPGLKLWVVHAVRVASRRGPDNRHIEVRDLLDGLAIANEPDLAPLIMWLDGRPTPALTETVETLQADVACRLDAVMARIAQHEQVTRKMQGRVRRQITKSRQRLLTSAAGQHREIKGGLTAHLAYGTRLEQGLGALSAQGQGEIRQVEHVLNLIDANALKRDDATREAMAKLAHKLAGLDEKVTDVSAAVTILATPPTRRRWPWSRLIRTA